MAAAKTILQIQQWFRTGLKNKQNQKPNLKERSPFICPMHSSLKKWSDSLCKVHFCDTTPTVQQLFMAIYSISSSYHCPMAIKVNWASDDNPGQPYAK